MPEPGNRIGPLLVGDRPLPASPEAESAVLSCLLLDPDSTLDRALSRLSSDECFHHAPHRKIFDTLREMRGEMIPAKIDLITISDRLERRGRLEEIGGEEYLSHLLNVVPTTANLETYLDCLLEAYILRRLITSCTDIVGRCYEAEGEVPELVDTIEQEIMGITEMRVETETKCIRELAVEAFDHLDKLRRQDPEVMGLPTDFPDLDKIITGLKPGDLFILAARPGIGKTTLALNIARNVAVRAKAAVGIFSLEMSSVQVVLRLMCSEAKINMKDVRDGRLSAVAWQNDLMPAVDRLTKMPLYVDDTAQLTSLELRQKARRMKLDHDVGLIVVDYLQLMRSVSLNKNATREQEVARLSGDIKALAKELKIPIMLLCQLNRQAEGEGKPRLSHLRESGAIEQDADIVALMHRQREIEVLDRPGVDLDDVARQGLECELIIAKHRNGETGIVGLYFLPQYNRFESRARVSDQDIPEPVGAEI